MKYRYKNVCNSRHTNNVCFLILEKCPLSKTFLRLDFSLFLLKGFDVLKSAFLDFLFYMAIISDS